MAINTVTVCGNLTRDPEVRQTRGGMPVMTFGVAVNDRRKNNQTGEWEDYANFFDCTMFGERAQSLSRYLSKGMKVTIDGKLRYSAWEKDGQKHSKVGIIAEDIEFMSQRGNGDQQQNRQQSDNGATYVEATYYEQPRNGYGDDDIPF